MRFSHSLAHTRDSSRGIQQNKIKGIKVKTRINWLQQGDKGSKFVFNMLRQMKYKERIDRIWDVDKDLVDSETFKTTILQYYQKLFTSENTSTTCALAREECNILFQAKSLLKK